MQAWLCQLFSTQSQEYTSRVYMLFSIPSRSIHPELDVYSTTLDEKQLT